MTAILVRDGMPLIGRIESIERCLRTLEEDAARTQAASLKQLEEDRIRTQVHSELWFKAFKAVAIAQVVFVIAFVIYRSW